MRKQYLKKNVNLQVYFPISPALYRYCWDETINCRIGVGSWDNNRDETINSIIAGFRVSFAFAITIDIPSAYVDTGVARHKTGRSCRD